MILMIRVLLLMELNDSLIKVLREFTAYIESMKYESHYKVRDNGQKKIKQSLEPGL